MAAASRALMYPFDISLLHMIMHKFPDLKLLKWHHQMAGGM